MKEVKRKLNAVDSKTKKNTKQEKIEDEDVDINIVLKQLSRYLTETDKK